MLGTAHREPPPRELSALETPVRLISRAALARNMRVVRSLLTVGTAVWPAVKAEAYGHGLRAIAEGLASLPPGERPDGFCVARFEEAMRLRDIGWRGRILVLAPMAGEVPLAAMTGSLDITVAAPEHVRAAAAAARLTAGAWRLGVHLKVDTGMHRVGCAPSEAGPLAQMIEQTPGLELRGVMSHLARADEPDDSEAVATTRAQAASFAMVVDEIRGAAFERGGTAGERWVRGDVLTHIANSGAICWHPEVSHDMVRPGLMIYGNPPGPARASATCLLPAMTLAAPVRGVHAQLPPEVAAQLSGAMGGRAAGFVQVGLGAAHGYSRRLAGIAEVVVAGRVRCRVVWVGVRDLWAELPPNCSADEELMCAQPAIALGPPATGAPSADDLAGIADTISYEITTGLRVPSMLVE